MKRFAYAAAMLALAAATTPARAQQQPPPEHSIRLNDADVNLIRKWGFEKPFGESADLLGKIYQQLQVEQMQRDAMANKAAREAIEKDLADKKAAEPAK